MLEFIQYERIYNFLSLLFKKIQYAAIKMQTPNPSSSQVGMCGYIMSLDSCVLNVPGVTLSVCWYLVPLTFYLYCLKTYMHLRSSS